MALCTPKFIHLWAPEFFWTLPQIPVALRPRPDATGADQFYLVCPDCGGRLCSQSGKWFMKTVVDFDGTGILCVRKYQCNACSATFKGWNPRVLQTLPEHIQIDLDVVVFRNFALKRSLA